MPLHAAATKASAPDPLAAIYARKRIDHALYLAGREFQRLYHLADKRRPDQPDGLADDQTKAWQALTACYRALGKDGSAIVCDVLIRGMRAGEVAKARGKAGQDGGKYYAKRFGECLSTLAEAFGFADGEKKARAGPKTQIIGAP